MTSDEKLAKLQKLRSAVLSSEAYLVDATGSDRRSEQHHLRKLQKAYHELRLTPVDDVPETTGVAGLVAS